MFSLRKKVIKYYQDRVAFVEMPNEFRTALKTHERVPIFIERLTKELHDIKGLREDQIQDSTYSMTDIFIASVKAQAEQRMLSPNEVARINFDYALKRSMAMQAERQLQAEREKINESMARRPSKPKG